MRISSNRRILPLAGLCIAARAVGDEPRPALARMVEPQQAAFAREVERSGREVAIRGETQKSLLCDTAKGNALMEMIGIPQL